MFWNFFNLLSVCQAFHSQTKAQLCYRCFKHIYPGVSVGLQASLFVIYHCITITMILYQMIFLQITIRYILDLLTRWWNGRIRKRCWVGDRTNASPTISYIGAVPGTRFQSACSSTCSSFSSTYVCPLLMAHIHLFSTSMLTYINVDKNSNIDMKIHSNCKMKSNKQNFYQCLPRILISTILLIRNNFTRDPPSLPFLCFRPCKKSSQAAYSHENLPCLESPWESSRCLRPSTTTLGITIAPLSPSPLFFASFDFFSLYVVCKSFSAAILSSAS